MTVKDLPTLNAMMNFISATLLLIGYIKIKQGKQLTHKKFMLAAFAVSALFLTSYVIYHALAGSTPYPHYDWTRTLYFIILIPHVILAAVMTPFILILLWFALRSRFDLHKKLARFVWPTWMFVSVTGIAVYLMLYVL